MNEGSNLNTMTIVVKSEVLDLDENSQGICFGHDFSKACHMIVLMKMFIEVSSLFQLSMHS